MKKYQFQYAHWKRATVTVVAADVGAARRKAADAMDRRYEKLDREPPVAWTLILTQQGIAK